MMLKYGVACRGNGMCAVYVKNRPGEGAWETRPLRDRRRKDESKSRRSKTIHLWEVTGEK